jgi:hypothetical protein
MLSVRFYTSYKYKQQIAAISSIAVSIFAREIYISVSQQSGRGPVPDPGINYTGP